MTGWWWSPSGWRGAGEAAERMRLALDAELQVLRDGGARVQLVTPDAASVAAFVPI